MILISVIPKGGHIRVFGKGSFTSCIRALTRGPIRRVLKTWSLKGCIGYKPRGAFNSACVFEVFVTPGSPCVRSFVPKPSCNGFCAVDARRWHAEIDPSSHTGTFPTPSPGLLGQYPSATGIRKPMCGFEAHGVREPGGESINPR